MYVPMEARGRYWISFWFPVWGSLSLNPGITDVLDRVAAQWFPRDPPVPASAPAFHMAPPTDLSSATHACIDRASPDSQKWQILGYSLLIMWQINYSIDLL